MIATDTRCPLCKARALQPTARSLLFDGYRKTYAYECSHCGLLFASNTSDASKLRAEDWLDTNGQVACRPDMTIGFDMFTLRMLAASWDYAAVPSNPAQRDAMLHPHSGLAGAANLQPLSSLAPTPITISTMCRLDDVEEVMERAGRLYPQAEAYIVVVDAEHSQALPRMMDKFFTVKARNLSRNFAAQRNYIQRLSKADWILQLDADEHIEPQSFAKLQTIATLADMQQIVSIGMPRQNYVDGVLVDLYPDVQYRLNRREVSYEGVVHERPDRPWQNSMIAVGTDIVHTLSSSHVHKRSKHYDDIDPGNGRLHEESQLTVPYRHTGS